MRYMFEFILCIVSILLMTQGVVTEGFSWYSIIGGGAFGMWYAMVFGERV